jgi:phosphoglycolate phosphatase
VCTNKPLHATQTILEKLELAGYFEARVVGGDGPLPRKPNPAGLAWLIAGAGVHPAETMLVGDSIIDWETAHAASAFVCMAGYGFGFEEFPRERLTADDRVVDRPRELLTFL